MACVRSDTDFYTSADFRCRCLRRLGRSGPRQAIAHSDPVGQLRRFFHHDHAATGIVEPAQCADLRLQISAIDARLLELKDGLTGDPRGDRDAKAEIAQLTRTRARIMNDAQTIGCSV